MAELPSYSANFANFRVYDAVYLSDNIEQNIVIEFRGSADESELLFTIINGRAIYATSIHELVHMIPSLVSLAIRHSVRILWKNEVRGAQFTEIFAKSQNPALPQVASLQVRLDVDGQTFQSSSCDSLVDAISELDEAIAPKAQWSLLTCFECAYAGYARDYALSDREYWCYRDVPEAAADIWSKGKQASQEARHAGRYFVDAFHTCAAWRSRPARSDTPCQTPPHVALRQF